MQQQLCLETLQRIEEQLLVMQAMVVAGRPKEELLKELMAAQMALYLVEEQVAGSTRGT